MDDAADAASNGRRSLGSGVKWGLEHLALPVAVLLVPLIFQHQAAKQAAERQAAQAELTKVEQNFKLYTEMLGKREQEDTQVRSQLFDKLLGTYLDPTSKDLNARLVALELLALNFHDALNLSPLFWELDRRLSVAPGAQGRALRDQLERVGQQVKERQAALLTIDGDSRPLDIDLSLLFPGAPPFHAGFIARLERGSSPDAQAHGREFSLDVTDHDPKNRRLFVVVATPDATGGSNTVSFWVDPYDFPLVSFSRVSSGERFAVIQDTYRPDVGYARLKFLYFRSERSGAKDKPFLDELRLKLIAPAASATLANSRPLPDFGPPAAGADAASVARR